MKFFVVFVLALAFFDGSYGALEKIDELAKKFGQDPVAVRQKMIEVIDELEKAANAAIDQAQDGTKKAGDLLQKAMLSALEMARKFLDSKSEQYNGVLNKGEEILIGQIAKFQQSLLSTQTTGRSGKQDLAWEVLYKETMTQIETVEKIIENSQIDAQYQAKISQLKQELNDLNDQNAQAKTGQDYRHVRRSWTKLSQNLATLNKEITSAMN